MRDAITGRPSIPVRPRREVELARITDSDIVALLSDRRLKLDVCGGISEARPGRGARSRRMLPNEFDDETFGVSARSPIFHEIYNQRRIIDSTSRTTLLSDRRVSAPRRNCFRKSTRSARCSKGQSVATRKRVLSDITLHAQRVLSLAHRASARELQLTVPNVF